MDKDGTPGGKDLWFDLYGYRSSVLFAQNFFLNSDSIDMRKTQVTQNGSDAASLKI